MSCFISSFLIFRDRIQKQNMFLTSVDIDRRIVFVLFTLSSLLLFKLLRVREGFLSAWHIELALFSFLMLFFSCLKHKCVHTLECFHSYTGDTITGWDTFFPLKKLKTFSELMPAINLGVIFRKLLSIPNDLAHHHTLF